MAAGRTLPRRWLAALSVRRTSSIVATHDFAELREMGRCAAIPRRAANIAAIVLLAFSVLLTATPAAACPFCASVGETLSERREAASIVAIVERADGSDGQPIWQLRHLIKGPKHNADAQPAVDPASLIPNASAAAAPAGLSLAFGVAASEPDKALNWQFTPASEVAAGYVVRAPDLRKPSADRLRFFARYLEHADALIAEDAFREFARAGFSEVAAVADALPMSGLRSWLANPATPPARKGFYALALGMAHDPDVRTKNRAALRQVIDMDKRDSAPGADFRPGFDGVLGGYLLLAGEAGLAEIAKRYFANVDAREIDVRQAIAALRFYHEHGTEIPLAAQCAALRLALRRPQLAEGAIIDLARWNDWGSLALVEAPLRDPAYREPRVRRAIAGYLLSCPEPAALAMVAKLRSEEPRTVEAAERALGGAASAADGAASAKPQ